MQYTLAALALVASVTAQGVSGVLKPSSSAPAGCEITYPGTFEFTVVKAPATSKRSSSAIAKRTLQKRACQSSGTAVLSLEDSILTDAQGRIGAIVANRQFQFDGPPAQTGSIYTGGWSICADGFLALGGSRTFYQCLSGDFYNLYDEPSESACEAVYFMILPCGSSTTPAPGQVSQIPDGQPQAPSAVSQISDGQVQAPTGAPVAQIPDGQVQAPTGTPVAQIPDGQVQAPTGTPVAQIPDGQVQAPTGAPVAQIPDGQVQAPTGTPVAQIPDGQVQAPTGAPVAQIPDGQVQAPTGPPVAQIPDGQIQNPANGTAPNGTAPASNATTTAAIAEFTGGASMGAQAGWIMGVVALVGGVAAL